MSSYGAPFQSNIFYYEPRDGGQVQIEGAVGQFQPLSGKTLGQNINNSWHHIAYGINNSNVYIYFDGVLNATANITAPVQCGVTTLGNVGGASKYANMLMDEFYIWNRSLTSTEIATLASSTTAGYYPFSTGTQQNIQMLNAYDNGTVLSFSVIATNGTTSYSATTTDGIAEFYNLTGNWNFNVTIPNYYESNKIFNTSFIGSATYTNYSIQSLFNVTAYEIITNNSLSNFNATTTNAFNSTSGSSLLLITNNASQTITGRKSGYLTATTNAQAVSGQITSVSLAFGQYLVSINITDAVTNVYLQNFSINLVALNYSDYNITQNTTSYSTSFTLLAGNYTLLLDSDGYAVKEVNLTVNSNVNYTLSLYQTNSFFIVYKDEITKATINNVSLQLISSIYSTNLSTNNGTMAFNLLTPSDYTFRYQGGSLYPQREYYQTLVNKQSYNLTLYLIQNSSASLITTTVYNQDSNLLQDATIKVLRYDITTNSYILVAEKITDSNGQAIFYLQPYGEYYKFIIEYDGAQYFESTPSQITTNSYIFTIVLTDVFGTTEFNAYQTNLNFSIVNTTTFRFYWNDAENEITQGCLYIYANNSNLISTSCSSGAAGILYYTTTDLNTTYKGNAFVYQGDKYTYVGTLWIRSQAYSSLENQDGSDMLFWLFIITLVLMFILALNAVLAMVVLPIPMILFNIFEFINFDWYYVVGLTFSSWLIAYIIEAKQ